MKEAVVISPKSGMQLVSAFLKNLKKKLHLTDLN